MTRTVLPSRLSTDCGLTPFAEKHAALGLGRRLRFHDFHHHRIDGDGEVLHHRIRDILDEAALLLERSSLDGVNLDFRHCSFSCPVFCDCGIFVGKQMGCQALAPCQGSRRAAITKRERSRPACY